MNSPSLSKIMIVFKKNVLFSVVNLRTYNSQIAFCIYVIVHINTVPDRGTR